MNLRDLVRRNLRFYWRTNAAVVAGIGIAAATLTGSAIVGESVKRSLNEIATGRIGRAEGALLASQPFSDSLPERLAPAAGPVLHFEAVIRHQPSRQSANKVLVYGVDDRFWKLHAQPSPGLNGRAAILSQPLALELNASPGDPILLRIEKPSEIPQESLHGRREQSVRTVRFTVQSVLPDSGVGGFSLKPTQGGVRAVFVPLAMLQKELALEGRANLALLPEALRSDIHVLSRLQLEDVGLKLKPVAECACTQLESPSGLLRDDQVTRALAAAKQQNIRAEPLLVYLANALRKPDASVPYSLVLAKAGIPEGSIVLNDWTARELAAQPGDAITLDYYLWRAAGRLDTESTVLTVSAIEPIPSVGDRFMAPEYPGISDTEGLSDWDPPFPMDLNKIRPQDETYWDNHRTTPKAALSLADGQRLWQSRFGKVTAIRLYGEQPFNLTPSVDLARDGLTLLNLREQAEQAAAGTTDFGEYFSYFSFFLTVSALLLTALFFRLGIEQRLREIGLYQSLGFDRKMVRKIFLREGLLLGLLGATAGAILGLGYAALILYGLGTWWVDAVGTTGLTLHIRPVTLAGAVPQGLLVAILVIAFTLRGIRNISPRQLLAGASPEQALATSGRYRLPAAIATAIGLLLLSLSASQFIPAAGGFFGAGLTLLAGAIFGLRHFLERPRTRPAKSVFQLAIASAAWSPSRSMYTAGLIAMAVFLLVALEAFRHAPGQIDLSKNSGAGGYPLMAESQWPIYQDLNLSDTLPKGAQIQQLRVRPGEETSCLNLYQPTRPKIAAIPQSLGQQGRFQFTGNGNWKLLELAPNNGAIPAIVDNNTMLYVLHKQIGDILEIPNGAEPLRLEIVAALSGSIFQSEILISESNFLKAFPHEQGFRMFLIEAPEPIRNDLTAHLEESLSDSGFDVIQTATRLAQYHRVENTYLSTFQALGALGLLVGTIGLAAVLLRNVLERRRQLALLNAVGFQQSDLFQLVLTENAMLLVAGLAAGTVTALLAVSPALIGRAQAAHPVGLLALISGVWAIGLLAAALATHIALKTPLLDALRSE